MNAPATPSFLLTAYVKPGLRRVVLPVLLAAGLLGCGGPQATETPTVPTAAPTAADSAQASPAAPAADATRTDTAAMTPAAPAKPVAKPQAIVKPAATLVPPDDVDALSPTPEETPVAVAPSTPEPAAPAAPATRTQSGRVLDEAGRPLAGATIMLKGSSKATSTDASGNYSLEVPASADNTFLIGYGGYEDETTTARDGQPLNVTLVPKAKKRRK